MTRVSWSERYGGAQFAEGILIDQGLADQFLAEQLYPEVFEAAAARRRGSR